MSNALPYNLDSLAGAAARVLIAPVTASLPVKGSDIFVQQSPYTVAGEWLDVGATSGPTVVHRNVTLGGYNIEQSQTMLVEEPTAIVHQLTVPFAELSPAVLGYVLNGTEVANSAVTTGTGTGVHDTDLASTTSTYGNIFDQDYYRIAMVVRRSKLQGVVTELTGLTRGSWVVFVGYQASMSAEDSAASFAKGTLANLPMTFNLYPDPTVTAEGEEFGFWLQETAGTFT
jgi:hypothetical protein